MIDRVSVEAVRLLRQSLGNQVLLLAHHYQRPEIVALADSVGDSLQLSRIAERTSAPKVVFCGVHFMGETAAILAPPPTEVYLPEPLAGCPMAEMADVTDLERIFLHLQESLAPRTIVPVTYVNSTAEVKAFTGRNRGAVCTSANASRVLMWARGQGDAVLFVPDRMLGANTAAQIWPEARLLTVDPFEPLPADSELSATDVFLWNGHCHVHTWFNLDHVAEARKAMPQARILVHPECQPEVVQASDGAGSTQYLVAEITSASPGSTLVIGTEINLVRRMAAAFPDRKVLPLASSLCPNMYKTRLDHVERLLSSWPSGCRVEVAPEIAVDARLALRRMLEIVQ